MLIPRILPLLVAASYLFYPSLSPAETPRLKIGIAGDSTVCDYAPGSRQQGWGQALPAFFSPETSFLNMAQGGRSTKTFPPDRWQKLIDFKPDFILIQFGHNDSHGKNQPEATDPATDFQSNLKRFIAEARAAGATPILITPVHRRLFDASGKMTQELAPYAKAMRAVAAETNTPLVDLHEASEGLFLSLGEEGSTPLTMNTVDKADRPDQQDRTHFTAEGAKAVAKLVAAGLAPLDPRLRDAEIAPAATP